MFTPQEAKYSGVSERFPPYMTSDGVGHTHLIPRGAPSAKSSVQCRLELELEFGVQRSLLVVLTSHVAQARVMSLFLPHTRIAIPLRSDEDTALIRRKREHPAQPASQLKVALS